MVGRGHAQRPSTDAASLSDVLFGRNPVRALLKGGGRRTDEIAVLAGAAGPLAEMVALARRAGVKVSYRTRDQLTAIAGSPNHQGVVARVAAAEYAELDDLLDIPSGRDEPAFFLALDQVQDPRNLGAVLRSADALGVHGVIVPKHHQVGLTGAAAKTAMGAADSVRVARETNLAAALEKLKQAGVWIHGAAATGGVAPWDARPDGPYLPRPGKRRRRPEAAHREDLRRSVDRADARPGRFPQRVGSYRGHLLRGRPAEACPAKTLDLTKTRN